MSYVDAIFDRDSDIIRVVERKDGKRHYHEYPVNIHSIMKILEVSTRVFMEIHLHVLCVRTQKTFVKKLLLTKAKTYSKATSILSFNV